MRLRAPWLVLAVLAPLIAGALGCARSAEERQLESMRDDIDRIQQERDGTDPPALPPEAVQPKASASPVPTPPSSAAPGAEVLRVGGPEEAIADDYAGPEDTTPRPNIRINGGPRSRANRQADEATAWPADEGPSLRSTLLDPEAKRSYDAALSLVNAKQYAKGLDALTAFLVKWPDHPYADHAMFWRGQCYFAEGDCARASEEFQGMMSRFPASAKTPDALLKLGVCYQRLGQLSQAKECFDRLTQDYPQADAARHIPLPPAAAASPAAPASEDHR